MDLNPRVLIVDDEPWIARGLQTFLEDEGMRVKISASAEEAMIRARDGESFDVCIMDMRLPGMNGDQAIRVLHELQPALQFLIHTGSTDFMISDDLRAIGVGDGQLFCKPLLDMSRLSSTVASLSRLRQGESEDRGRD